MTLLINFQKIKKKRKYNQLNENFDYQYFLSQITIKNILILYNIIYKYTYRAVILLIIFILFKFLIFISKHLFENFITTFFY